MLGISAGIKPVDVKKTLIFVHRWMGVALCLLFLLWFASGIVMMYWDYPEVTAADRLQHLPPVDASRVRLSVLEAYKRLGLNRDREPLSVQHRARRPPSLCSPGRTARFIPRLA